MDCGGIPELGYNEFGQRVLASLNGERYPFSGSIELTFRCNLRCKHCYLDEVHDGTPGDVELSKSEWYSILDQLADTGTLKLLITGGEPLVRDDFVDIYTYAKRKGFLITLFTNGTLITPDLARYLRDWQPAKIEVTIYGSTQTTYEALTGIDGSFNRCMAGIERLVENGLPLKLKTMVTTINKHELEDMRDLASKLGVSFRYDAILNPGLAGGVGPTALRLSPEEVVSLDTDDPQRRASWEEYATRYKGYVPDDSRLYQCGAGKYSFHIDPYGMLSVCMLSRGRQYNLREGSFTEGWREFLGAVRDSRVTNPGPCRQCALVPFCDFCPGWREMVAADSSHPDQWACSIAHLRARAFAVVID